MGDVRLTGDFKELRDLAKSLERAAQASFRADINKQLAEEARTQAQLGFAQSRDPYGNQWAPVARGGQPLLDKGRLRSSLTPSASEQAFTISTDVAYAGVHQAGATIKAKEPKRPLRFKINGKWVSKYQVTIKRRQFMPEGEIGPIWMSAFEKVVAKTMELFGR